MHQGDMGISNFRDSKFRFQGPLRPDRSRRRQLIVGNPESRIHNPEPITCVRARKKRAHPESKIQDPESSPLTRILRLSSNDLPKSPQSQSRSSKVKIELRSRIQNPNLSPSRESSGPRSKIQTLGPPCLTKCEDRESARSKIQDPDHREGW